MGNVHQTNIGSMPKGKAGQLYGDPFHYREESFGVSEGRQGEISTITCDTATDDATYGAIIFGEAISFTADGTATVAEVSAGLLAAAEANPVITGLVTIVDDTVDTITITGRYPGVDLDIELTDSASLMTLAQSQAESEGDTLPFARVVLHDPNDASKVVAFAAPAARVITLTPTVADAADTNWGASVTIEGETYEVEYTGDGTATAQEVVEGLTTALNAALPANTVIVTEDDSDLILTGEVEGTPFDAHGVAGTTNTWVKAVTEAGDNLANMAGITRYTYEEASNTIGDASDVGYPPGRDAIVLQKGRLYVTEGNSATRSSSVFIGTDAAERGQIFDADGTGRIAVTDGSLKWAKANVIDIDLR